MHVNPVVPPIDRFGIECKEFSFFRTQGGGKQSRVLAFENMFVVKDERLVKFDQFLGSIQVALGLGQRRLLQPEESRHAIDAADDRFLHRNRKALIALLGDRNCFEFHFEPMVDALLGFVMFAMRQTSEFDAPAHVARRYA